MSNSFALNGKPMLTLAGGAEIEPKTLAYLATPYTNYPDGIEIAFREASRLAAELLKLSIETYSPIAHCHPLAIYGDLDALDRDMWLRYQENMMHRCDVLIVAEMKSWKQSHGIAHEVVIFENQRKPIFQLNPDTMTLRCRSYSRLPQKERTVTDDALQDHSALLNQTETEKDSLAHDKTQSEHAGSSS